MASGKLTNLEEVKPVVENKAGNDPAYLKQISVNPESRLEACRGAHGKTAFLRMQRAKERTIIYADAVCARWWDVCGASVTSMSSTRGKESENQMAMAKLLATFCCANGAVRAKISATHPLGK